MDDTSADAPLLLFERMTAGWVAEDANEDDKEMLIKDFSACFKSGQKIGVIGPVGSGKTSFLMSILGEMQIKHGKLKIQKNTQIVFAE